MDKKILRVDKIIKLRAWMFIIVLFIELKEWLPKWKENFSSGKRSFGQEKFCDWKNVNITKQSNFFRVREEKNDFSYIC